MYFVSAKSTPEVKGLLFFYGCTCTQAKAEIETLIKIPLEHNINS